MKRNRTNRLKEIDPKVRHRVRYKMKLAAKIDDLRLARKLNKSTFATEIGQEPSVITKWLSGTHNFTADTLSEIAFFFGVETIDVSERKLIREYTISQIITVVGFEWDKINYDRSIKTAGSYWKMKGALDEISLDQSNCYVYN